MASTTAFTGEKVERNGEIGVWKDQLYESIGHLSDWIERNDYRGYDTFDGLNARFVRPLTFERKFLRTVLQQGVRRFPLNLRPLLGVHKSYSTKGMGFLARGFMRLHASTGDQAWRDKAEFALQWLIDQSVQGLQWIVLGKPFRLSIENLLFAERYAYRCLDLTHRPCIPRRV